MSGAVAGVGDVWEQSEMAGILMACLCQEGTTAVPPVLTMTSVRPLLPGSLTHTHACRRRGLANLTVLTADLVSFEAPAGARYDRVVSVECFEHMKVWGRGVGVGGLLSG